MFTFHQTSAYQGQTNKSTKMSDNCIFRIGRAVYLAFAVPSSPLHFTLLPLDSYKMIKKDLYQLHQLHQFLSILSLYIYLSIARMKKR